MKLTKFRLQNYKSFVDSGVCNVQDGVTILAGQNESGKTNILDALVKINADKPAFSQDEYSFSNTETSPTITYWFELSDSDHQQLTKEFPTVVLEDEVVAYVDAEGFEIDFTDTQREERCNKAIEEFLNNTKDLKITMPQNKGIEYAVEFANSLLTNSPETWTPEQLNAFTKAAEALKKTSTSENSMVDEISNTLWKMVPKFIAYKTITDDIPDDFTVNDLTKTGIRRLDKYLGGKFKKVFDANGSPQRQMNLAKNLSTTVSGDFSSKYKQKDIELEFNINGAQMTLFILDKHNGEKGYAFLLSQRSMGLRWYLNFYIALKGEDLRENDIILIDEPGLYLHPKAQEEMRGILNEASKNNQIIYTTHSPYLIDTDRIEQVRLVEKTPGKVDDEYNEISRISNGVHRCDSIDTMKPIIDAIGYSLGSELNQTHDKVLICEGVSDYYFVKMLEVACGESLCCGITHANGCGNISKVNSLFLGLGIVDTYALVDADSAGVRERKKLIQDGVFTERTILTTDEDPQADKEIEDVLNRDYVLSTFFSYKKEDLDKADAKLSKEIKKKLNGAKFTLSKQLYDMATKRTLDTEKLLTEDAHKLFLRLRDAVKGDLQNGDTNNQ